MMEAHAELHNTHDRGKQNRWLTVFVISLFVVPAAIAVTFRYGLPYGMTPETERSGFFSQGFLVCKSPDMAPTVLPDDTAIVNFSAYEKDTPQRWDMVVMEVPDGPPVDQRFGRIVALPGETVQLVDGQILINGAAVDKPPELPDTVYTQDTSQNSYGSGTDSAFIQVPGDAYFVLGDNPELALDSRTLGWIPERNIEGKVVRLLKPERTEEELQRATAERTGDR
ncbi:MAG: signal peptidase I [Candidatus Hydrogenedentes bacterium]|nr:signal peptidase I [Candidatus Hydrogenedentota bacterium]